MLDMSDTKRTYSILVVEDEQPLLNAIRLKLEKSGFEVVTSRNVEQALGYCRDDVQVDAVWLDHYLLGKETGLDFLATLKNSDHQHIPIFVVSNTGSPDKRQAYMRLGATKYFVKSDIRLDTVIQEMREYLDKESKE